MKKILSYIAVFLLLIPYSAFASDTFISIAPSHSGSCRLVDDVTKKVAQAFTPSSSGTLDSIAFYQTTTSGSPSNTVTVRVYSDSGGSPGSLLATGSTIGWTSDAGWATSTITTSLVSGTTYWAEADNGGSGSSSDILRMGGATGSFTQYQHFASGSWGTGPCGSNNLTTEIAITAAATPTTTPTSSAVYNGLNREEELFIAGILIFMIGLQTWSYMSVMKTK